MNHTIEHQLQHRTIREFERRGVDKEVLDQLFEVAMRTASSRGLQQASIIHVTDADLQRRLAEIGQQEYVGRAPVYLLFIVDTARNAALLDDPSAAGHTRPFVEGFTDACLMAQNVVNAAESLGMGANYLGNIHNDLQAVVDLLELPRFTFPVVGLTLGWPAQEPQLKPRIPARLRVMENTYQAPASWSEALGEYDQEMTTYYDLRDKNRRSDKFFRQVRAGLPTHAVPQDGSLDVARRQGFEI
ncbi:nitroreductase family protein [Corynebacterium sp. UMB10321]|uniref:nitroreductase family protein n=1 Tax=Corynebacterium sp. UMB10321 TaxID=3046312 RepID=UPI00254B4E7E|nr:nitroreductase family protein [Corynebacterium sp. UMB10321]MDK8244992.1 nitroreductase family protein [Corynebacterium sp. UMB10321]